MHESVLPLARKSDELRLEYRARIVPADAVPGEKLHDDRSDPGGRARSFYHQYPGNKRHEQEQVDKMAASMPLLPFQISAKKKDAADHDTRIEEKLPMFASKTECYGSGEQDEKHMVRTAAVTIINKEPVYEH